MKKIFYSLTAISLFIGLASNDVFALSTETVLVPSIKAEGPSSLVLQKTYDEASDELQKIEDLNRDKFYGLAKLKAINLFDRINLVHPFVKVITQIPANGILNDYEIKYSFQALSAEKQDAIALVVANYKGGAFINLLNLAKRTRLQYLIAFYGESKKNLRIRDIEYIKTEIIKIHNIALLIKDQNAKNALMLFDVDVASPDKQYDFNRELLEFIIDHKVLKLSEFEFENLLSKDRENRLQNYHRSLPGGVPSEVPSKVISSSKLSKNAFGNCVNEMKNTGGMDKLGSLDFCNGPYSRRYYWFSDCMHQINDSIGTTWRESLRECISRSDVD